MTLDSILSAPATGASFRTGLFRLSALRTAALGPALLLGLPALLLALPAPGAAASIPSPDGRPGASEPNEPNGPNEEGAAVRRETNPPGAQEAAPGEPQEEAAQETEATEEEEAEEAEVGADRLRYSETVVVSASRIEQEIVNAPAAITVLDVEQIEGQASGNFADLVRQAPGVNVTQLSNRDFNVTSRAASGTLATSQLVLVDGRSVYQDFFGFVAWDLISVGLEDLERVEVVNGPASAVWGANAMSGVVNLITRAPRDSEGTTLDLRYGRFDRTVPGADQDPGSLLSGTLTHARAVSDTLAYRVSASFTQQDAFARPQGEIPNGSGTLYPSVAALDTRLPKLDVRVDWDAPDRSSGLRVTGGYAGTQGILHSGLGPLEIRPGGRMGYGRVQYLRDSMEFGAFVNHTAADFDLLLVQGPGGNKIESQLDTTTYDLSFKDTRFLGTRQILSYGASARFISLDLGIAPLGSSRNEQGAYVNNEIFFGDRVRWIVGARADRISTVDRFVISPRTTLMLKPTPEHSIRFSYGQAFRAPSLTNSYLQVDVTTPAEFDLRPAFRGFLPWLTIPDSALPAPVTYRVPFVSRGSLELEPETLTAWEVGWAGALTDRIGGSAAFYLSTTRNVIDFTDTEFWSATRVPDGWRESFAETTDFVARLAGTLPPGTLPESVAAVGRDAGALIPLLATLADVQLPAVFTYVNRESIRNRGVELGLHAELAEAVHGYVNYSWQDDPEATGYSEAEMAELPQPAKHRVNAGLNAGIGVVNLGVTASYQGRAFWTDVLTSDYHGWTEPFTMVNTSLSVDLLEGRLRPGVRVVNLLNQDIQQHIFGDVLKRQIIGQLRFRF